jgi:ABC-type branched-subunit amino acid transport system ATPase component
VTARGIAKSYGATRALTHVDITLRRGEIHALLGGNGAGKSTLIAILDQQTSADHDGDKITTQCLITMELERGSLTLQSLWVKGTSPLDMAISGGTGVYLNARGTVRFWDIATPNERLRAEIVY